MSETGVVLSRAEEIVVASLSDVWRRLSVEYIKNPDEDLRIALNELSKWEAAIRSEYRNRHLSELSEKRSKEIAEFIASFK